MAIQDLFHLYMSEFQELFVIAVSQQLPHSCSLSKNWLSLPVPQQVTAKILGPKEETGYLNPRESFTLVCVYHAGAPNGRIRQGF